MQGVFIGLALGILALFFGGMRVFRECALRQPQRPTAETLKRRAERWGLPVERLLAAADWFAARESERLWATGFDDLCLSARWLPAEASRGRILLFHGHRSGGVEDFAEALRFYHELGFDLLLVDQRAHGESQGQFMGLGVLERRDCLTWLEEVNRRFGPDVPTFLAGVSMGATTVLLAAGEPLPDNVRGIIADCGFTSARDIAAYQVRRRLHLPAFPLTAVASGLCRLLAGYGFGDAAVPQALERSTLPILFLHGEADDYVPVEMTLRSYNGYAGKKRLYLVPGADHTGAFSLGGEACSRTIEAFLEDCLAGKL